MHLQIGEEDNRVVFINDERVLGIIMQWGAHASQVKYSVGGVEYQVWMENDEFIPLRRVE